jgi:hypothetical protein
MMKKILLAAAVIALIAGYCFGDDISDALGKNGASPVAGLLGHFSTAGLLWGIVFGGVGVGAFIYGKKKSNAAFMLIGILLSGYTFVIQDTFQIVLIGAVLTGSLYFFRRG